MRLKKDLARVLFNQILAIRLLLLEPINISRLIEQKAC